MRTKGDNVIANYIKMDHSREEQKKSFETTLKTSFFSPNERISKY
jgi:hypothetical protein